MTYTCKKCGSETQGITREQGNQIGLYCEKCGAWIKWLSHKAYELRKLQATAQSTINHNALIVYHCLEKQENCGFADCYGNCTLGSCTKLAIKPTKEQQTELPNELTFNGVVYVKKGE